MLAEASASLTPPNKEEGNTDSADTDSAVARQNQLNEKQAQGNNESYRLGVFKTLYIYRKTWYVFRMNKLFISHFRIEITRDSKWRRPRICSRNSK